MTSSTAVVLSWGWMGDDSVTRGHLAMCGDVLVITTLGVLPVKQEMLLDILPPKGLSHKKHLA